MTLSNKNTHQFAIFYAICSVFSYSWYQYYNLTFSSLSPVYFTNRLDLTLNIVLMSNLQHILISNKWLRILFDILFLIFPVFLMYCFIKTNKFQKTLAIITSIFCTVYSLMFSAMSFISIEVFLAWMLIPLIFFSKNIKSFYYFMHSLRILFIIFFFSGSLWKVFSNAIFNTEQMSSILLFQHANYLASEGSTIYKGVLFFLIKHSTISLIFYLAAFFAEFIFIIGLFTKKFDKGLIFIFCLFLFFDYAIMGINYTSWLPFMGCFYFSNLTYSKLKNEDS